MNRYNKDEEDDNHGEMSSNYRRTEKIILRKIFFTGPWRLCLRKIFRQRDLVLWMCQKR